MRTAGGGVGGAVLLLPSSFCVISSVCSPLAGAALDGRLSKGSHGCLSCQGLGSRLSVRRRRPGRRFQVVRANREDKTDRNQDGESNQNGETGPVDWDKAWSSFKKPPNKKSFLKIDMEQYVSRKPNHSNYPLSEEVDPLRKTERSALGAWTSLKFTYAFVFIIIGLAVYMVIIVGPPPHH